MNGKYWAIPLLTLLVICGVACSRETAGNSPVHSNIDQPIPDADLRILFIGNSHTSANNIPGMVKTFIEGNGESKTVAYRTIGVSFLESVAKSQRSIRTIQKGKWDFIVLQGQKISTSGKYHYSTDPAKKLCKLASQSGAKVILFAEWGLRGKEGDADRIHSIYQDIQSAGDSVVAPIGKVWDAAFAKDPDLKLHARDGNHSNFQGAMLAALTLYSIITERDCRELPNFKPDKIKVERQKQFKDVTWSVVEPYLTNTSDQPAK